MKKINEIIISKNTPLSEVLALSSPCMCDSCNNGCKHGSGILIGNDRENIAKFLKITEKELDEKYLEETEQFNKKFQRPKLLRQGKPFGQCVFFDGKGCKVHEVKPLQCKTAIACKDYGEDVSSWFLANNLLDLNDAEAIRQYKQYQDNGGKIIPGASLEELFPDKKELKKILSYEVLK